MQIDKKYNFNPFAPLIIRLAVGFYFFLLGLWGYLEPVLSRQAIERYAGFSVLVSGLYVNIGLYVFFMVGVMLILGLFTRVVALTAALVVLPLLYGAGIFSAGDDSLIFFLERRSLFRDVVVFAGCLSLTLSGPGALSLDLILPGVYGKDS